MSHRKPMYDTQQGASRTKDATVPRTARLPTSRNAARQLESTRPATSTQLASRLPPLMTGDPAGSVEKPGQRQTGIPRWTTRNASQRSTNVSNIASTTPGMRKSTVRPDSQSQEVPLLMESSQGFRRRGQASGNTDLAQGRDPADDTLSSLDIDQDAIFGIVMPRANAAVRTTELPPRLIPELQALAASSTRLPQAPTVSVSSFGSPSTRFSSSPSPWSVSTTTTTPTSWSSASPGIVQQVPMTSPAKRSQTVPLPSSKPERTTKLPALPEPVRPSIESEWLASSKSSRSLTKRRPPLQTPAPTPPPRTSSAKHSLSRSSSKSDRVRATPAREPTPFSSDFDRSPLASRGVSDLGSGGKPLQHRTLTQAHDSLQQSLIDVAPQVSHTRADGSDVKETFGTESYRLGLSTQGLPTTFPETFSVRQRSGSAQQLARDQPRDYLPKTPEPQEVKVQNSPGRAGKFSRFGLFGRGAKSPASEVEKSPRKLQRKGPATGTGHEGYGKYARRGRKPSQESASAKGSESERSVSSTRRAPLFSSKGKNSRSSSRHNRNSQSDLDDFASTRLKPVPIIGGSGNSTRSNSGSQLDVYSTSAAEDSTFGRGRNLSQSQTSLGEHPEQDTPLFAWHQTPRQGGKPALAMRRSQRFVNDAESFNLLTPIKTEGLAAPLNINSQDESRSSAFPASTPSTTTEFSRGDVGLLKPKEKRSRKLRWNIFRRKGTEPEPEMPVALPSSSPEEMSVSVSAIPVSRPMPYYAMMDSESEINPAEHVGDYLAQVVASPAVSPLIGGGDADFIRDEPQTHAYEDNVFLPSVPTSPPQFFAQSPPPVSLHNSVDTVIIQQGQSPQRQPRLVRVGRIPPVAPREERQHKPSRSSFSQPFVRASAAEDVHAATSTSETALSVPLHISTDVLPSRPFSGFDSAQPASAPSYGETEFLRYLSRQPSEVSTSSSSGGVLSILGPALVPDVAASRGSRRSGPHQSSYLPGSPSIDEVWNEYDDFIDQVMSPSRARKSIKALSASDNTGLQSHDLDPELIPQDSSRDAPLSDSMPWEFPAPSMKRPVLGSPATSVTPPVVFPPPTMPERVIGEDIRLRRSRIVSALQSHSSMDLASPFSIRDLLSEYETQPRDSTGLSERLSKSTADRSLERLPTATSAPDLPASPSHQENVAMLEVVQRSKDPAGQSELHYASLMVAKWLSFGRVLFSPAHDEIQTLPERHILVIDGLGNEDWSIYCAVTYEAQRAFVHDLKEKTSKKASRTSKASQHAPDNHRRAEVASFSERFPFPPAFFSAVVLRFPPAMAEAKMKNMISECRRVLLPGGYLELMLLDLDIVNMGVQTRRAVRELKFRMTTADKQISLRPIIDNVQSVLGSRGLTNISRCVVGVPVAGRPSGTADSSSSSRSSRGSNGSAKGASGDARLGNASPRMTFGQGRKGANVSLNDLLSDRSDNADLRIGKIVSRTARTWWQHCFEASVINDGNLARSIFADKNVLAECKERGSSFKLLIAYAQRPVFETRRRTMSEPVVPTLATAGSKRQPQPSSSNPRTA